MKIFGKKNECVTIVFVVHFRKSLMKFTIKSSINQQSIKISWLGMSIMAVASMPVAVAGTVDTPPFQYQFNQQNFDSKMQQQLDNQTLTEFDNFQQPIATFQQHNVKIMNDELMDKPLSTNTNSKKQPVEQQFNQQNFVNVADNIAKQSSDNIDEINPNDYLPEYEQQTDEQKIENTKVVAKLNNNPLKKVYNRLLNRIDGVNYIDVKIVNADEKLQPAKNIKSALEQVTVESVEDFQSSINRLRQIALEASQAVGYYETVVSFKHLGSNNIQVSIDKVGEPVLVENRIVEIRGEGTEGEQALSVFEAMEQQLSPKHGEIFHHGVYQQAKASIENSALTNGFFDGQWLNKSVDIILPDNVADVDLVYDTKQRYQFGDIKIYSIDKQGNLTDDPEKLPIKPAVLQQLLTYQKGDNYYQPAINELTNNLSATRYFNGIDVDVVLPSDNVANANLSFNNQGDNADNLPEDNNINIGELAGNRQVQNPDDIAPVVFQVDDTTQQRLDLIKAKARLLLQAPEDIELAPEEKNTSKNPLVVVANAISDIAKQIDKNSHDNQPQIHQTAQTDPIAKLTPEQVAIEKQVPTYIVLNANKPKEAQIGLGYETDTGVRVLGKLKNNLVNRNGYQAGISVAVAKNDQAVEITGSHPYKHPLNDKLTGSLGYEHKSVDNLNSNFETQSLYASIARNIRRETGWNRTYSLRYRIDKLSLNATYDDLNDLPPPFNNDSSNYHQQALLFGYGLHKTVADNLLNPTTGYSQRYSVELATDNLLSDTNMAIIKAGATGIYSFGEQKQHQVIGRMDLGYIYTDSFFDVPYRLRFFAGGDQSIRGYGTDTQAPRYEGSFLLGGNALAVGSFEYNYEFKTGLRGAIFTDFGNAYDLQGDESNSTKIGAGVGVRWASPIGIVRLDVASAISDDGNPLKIHFLIGSPL